MKVERLGNIVKIQKGKKHLLAETKSQNSIRFLQIEDLRNDKNLKFTEDTNGVLAFKNDILIAWDGANAGTIGFGKEGFIGSTIALLRIKNKEKYDYQFIGYLLKTKSSKLKGSSTGATIPHLSRRTLDDIKIPVIPLAEQQKIAYILSKAEALIQKRKETINGLDELLKYTFLDMFGDPVENPKGWETSFLGKECEFENGDRSSNYPNENDLVEDGVIFINSGNIKNFRFRPDKPNFITEAKSKSLKNGHCIKGDILFTLRGNGLGKSCIFNSIYDKGFVNAQIVIIRTTESLLNPFLIEQFRHPSLFQMIWKLGSGSAQPQLSVKQLKKLQIITPPLTLQTQFAQIVEKVDALLKKQEDSLKEILQLYQSLMQRAFKGELDLEKVEIEDVYDEFEYFDGGFVPIEEAQPALDKIREEFESLPAIKSKDKELIEKIKSLDSDKAQLGRIPFDKDYAIYRVLIPQYKKNELVSFSTIYELLLTEFENLSYNEVKEFIFEDINSDEPFIKQVFDTDTKEIKLKLTQ